MPAAKKVAPVLTPCLVNVFGVNHDHTVVHRFGSKKDRTLHPVSYEQRVTLPLRCSSLDAMYALEKSLFSAHHVLPFNEVPLLGAFVVGKGKEGQKNRCLYLKVGKTTAVLLSELLPAASPSLTRFLKLSILDKMSFKQDAKVNLVGVDFGVFGIPEPQISNKNLKEQKADEIKILVKPKKEKKSVVKSGKKLPHNVSNFDTRYSHSAPASA